MKDNIGSSMEVRGGGAGWGDSFPPRRAGEFNLRKVSRQDEWFDPATWKLNDRSMYCTIGEEILLKRQVQADTFIAPLDREFSFA